jgi:hypothetical protein
MDESRTLRIASLEDQIWSLNIRKDTMRDELPSSPAGSQERIDAEKDLSMLRAEIKGLVRERERLEAQR